MSNSTAMEAFSNKARRAKRIKRKNQDKQNGHYRN